MIVVNLILAWECYDVYSQCCLALEECFCEVEKSYVEKNFFSFFFAKKNLKNIKKGREIDVLGGYTAYIKRNLHERTRGNPKKSLEASPKNPGGLLLKCNATVIKKT